MTGVIQIYALCCPESGNVHYVGQSKKPKQRLVTHKHSPGSSIAEWIGKLKSRSLSPVLKVLETCDVNIASDREYFWISHYLNIGNLMNKRTSKNWPFTSWAVGKSERFPLAERHHAVQRAHNAGAAKGWKFVSRTVTEDGEEWCRIWRTE